MKKLVLLPALCLIFLLAVPSTHTAAVDVGDSICSEEIPEDRRPAICADLAQSDNPDDDVNPLYGPDGVITRAVNGLSIVLGVTAVIIIIIAGIRMTLSTGDPAKIKQSRDAVIYAAVGLVVAVLAQAIVRFVLNRIGVGG
jgi:hypothetical protein